MDNVVVAKIKGNWSTEKDTCTESPNFSWVNVSEGRASFPYEHGRPLTYKTAKRALTYIKHLVSGYPHQLRYTMAKPLWERFCQEWCDTGSESEAMKAI